MHDRAAQFSPFAALTGFGIPTNRIVDLGDKAFVGTKYWNEWPDNSLVTNGVYILGFKGNPTSVELPEGCVAIPAEMFKGMTALTNVVIPASVKKVGLRAFAGSGVLTVVLPNVTELGVSAFEGCANLTAIVLAEGLGEIPDSAFRKCSSLLAVDIPGSVISIGAEAFRDCIALRDVTGGEGVLSVDDYAFAGCVRLQPFRFPQDVAYGEHVFQDVRWTENVLFPSVGTMAQEYPQTYAEIKSVVVSSTQTGIVDRACAGCASLELVVLPDGVRHVGASAFEGCVALTSVVLSVSVSNVGSNAFKGCSSIISLAISGDFVVRDVFPESYATMKSVKIASGVTSLCDNMLEGCAAIASIELPKSLSEIGAFAFAGCKGLQPGITIPEEVTSIGDYAFKGCIGLSIVRYMGEMPEANPNIYSGTKESLVSGVRKKYEESWTVSAGTNGTSRTLPERWPQSPSNRVISVSSRRIAWWSGPSDAGETTGAITFYYYDATGGKGTFGPEDWLDEPPDEREGYEFAGWVKVSEEPMPDDGAGAPRRAAMEGIGGGSGIGGGPSGTGTYVSTDVTYPFIMTDNVEYRADFKVLSYDVTIEACEHGTIRVEQAGKTQPLYEGAAGTELTIPYNTVLTITAIADTENHYEFKSWIGDGAESVTVDGEKTIGVIFGKEQVTFTVAATNGSINVTDAQKNVIEANSNSYTVDYGTVVFIKAQANTGYYFDKGSDEGIENPYEKEVTSTFDLTATFAANFVLIDNKPEGDTWYDTYAEMVGVCEEKPISVTFERTFTAGNWTVFSLPFIYSFLKPENQTFRDQVYEFDNAMYDEGYLQLNFIRQNAYIEANKPYLLHPFSTITNPIFENVRLVEIEDATYEASLNGTDHQVQLINTTHYTTLPVDKNIIFLNQNTLYYPSKPQPFRAFRGYFNLGMTEEEIKHAPKIRIVVDGEEVMNLEDEAAEEFIKKYFDNEGNLIIENNGVKYDAQGKQL